MSDKQSKSQAAAEEEEAARKKAEEEEAAKEAAEYQSRARKTHEAELSKRDKAKKAAPKPDGHIAEGKALVCKAKVYGEGEPVFKAKIGADVFGRHKKLGTIK